MLSPVPLNAQVVDGSEVLRFNVLLLGLDVMLLGGVVPTAGASFAVLALC